MIMDMKSPIKLSHLVSVPHPQLQPIKEQSTGHKGPAVARLLLADRVHDAIDSCAQGLLLKNVICIIGQAYGMS
jgi:hypothetical protein